MRFLEKAVWMCAYPSFCCWHLAWVSECANSFWFWNRNRMILELRWWILYTLIHHLVCTIHSSNSMLRSGRRGMPGGPGPVGPPGYCQFCEALKMQANAGSQKKGWRWGKDKTRRTDQSSLMDQDRTLADRLLLLDQAFHQVDHHGFHHDGYPEESFKHCHRSYRNWGVSSNCFHSVLIVKAKLSDLWV